MTADTFDPRTVSWVATKSDLGHLLAGIEEAESVVLDLETSGLSPHGGDGIRSAVVLASLTLPRPDDRGDPTTYLLPLNHPQSPWRGQWRAVLRLVVQRLRDTSSRIENHHLKFDLTYLHPLTKIDLSKLAHWDTQLAAYALDENESSKLKDVVPRLFGVPPWDDFDLSKPGAAYGIPLIDLGLYAARDTYWTWKLGQLQREQMFLADDGAEPVDREETTDARLGELMHLVIMPTARSLTRIQQNGIGLDVDWCKDKLTELQETVDTESSLLASRYPLSNERAVSWAPTSIWFREWAQAAVDAGDLRVAALTPTGLPQWSRSVLVRQARTGHPAAEHLLRLRKASKQAEFVSKWLTMSHQDTIYASYNVGSVVTGRLSSSEPNMQQVTYELRPAFIPSPGHVFLDLDYSQIELRVAAFISRCEPMITAFQRGDDLHRLLAKRIVQQRQNRIAIDQGIDPIAVLDEQVTPEHRQAGKSANFGLLYGMGVEGFQDYAADAYDVSMSFDEAQEVHAAFFTMWTGIQEWHHKSVATAVRQGYVTSPIGRVRRVPDIYSQSSYLASRAERAAINSPVQGFASDLMQVAGASIQGVLDPHHPLGRLGPVRGARVVGTVHDSILIEAPADDWERVAAECIERMVNPHPWLRALGCTLDVPLAVEGSVGTRWGLADVGEVASDG